MLKKLALFLYSYIFRFLFDLFLFDTYFYWVLYFHFFLFSIYFRFLPLFLSIFCILEQNFLLLFFGELIFSFMGILWSICHLKDKIFAPFSLFYTLPFKIIIKIPKLLTSLKQFVHFILILLINRFEKKFPHFLIIIWIISIYNTLDNRLRN